MNYSIYTFDNTGHVTTREDVERSSDEGAIASAHQLSVPVGGRVEVWEHSRMVATIPGIAEVRAVR